MKNYFVIIILFFLYSLGYSQNQLKNPGFEESGAGWNFWGGVQQEQFVRSGKYAMKVTLDKPQWSGADQIIFFPEGVAKVEVTGWMKTENVKMGLQNYEQARIAVEFLDNGGTLNGGYPPVVGQIAGTTGWTYYNNTYLVPQGARQLKVQAVLGNCTGVAYFDDLEVFLYDDTGAPLEAGSKSGPMDEGRWYAMNLNTKATGSHYVDWSVLLDAPAGKHGFVKAVNGHLQFEDGTPASFWGTNLVADAAFPDKKNADSVASRLAKMGCNLIRLHHMDAPWSKPNIFGNTSSTLNLSKESLDKLDYLVAALKKKGIYIYLDLLVHRDFMISDGVTNRPPDLGGKQVGYFDDKLIALQKEYARQLLLHKNPYTGLSYADEPAIMGSEFINESSAFLHFGGDILTDPYRADLQKKFEVAGNVGKKLAVFDLDYSKGASPRLTPRPGVNGDVEATLRFLSGVERKYYTEMKDFMRGLGVKYVLSGSNFPCPVLPYQYNNYLTTDLIITNDYWDHPQLWKINNDWNRVLYAPINNTSIIRNPFTSTIHSVCKYKWNGKPSLVTEYNICYPNEYRLEGVPLVAAYSRLQGMDGMLQFDFNLDAVGGNRITPFTLSKMPDHLAQWVLAAPMFLRKDIAEAKGLVLDVIKEKQLYTMPGYSEFLDDKNFLPYVTKVAKTFESTPASDASNYSSYYDEKNGIIKSETGELTLKSLDGVFEVNTPTVQAVMGNMKDRAVELPVLSCKIKNSWASIGLVSADGKPLQEAKKLYLVVVTPVKMSGQKFNAGRGALVEIGNLPLMAQYAEGECILKVKAAKAIVTPLMPDGSRGRSTIFVPKPTGVSVKLNDGRTFVYEILLD